MNRIPITIPLYEIGSDIAPTPKSNLAISSKLVIPVNPYNIDEPKLDLTLLIENIGKSIKKEMENKICENNVALISGSGQPKSMVLTNPVNVLVFTSDCNNGFPGFEIKCQWIQHSVAIHTVSGFF